MIQNDRKAERRDVQEQRATKKNLLRASKYIKLFTYTCLVDLEDEVAIDTVLKEITENMIPSKNPTDEAFSTVDVEREEDMEEIHRETHKK